jgi:broad specificity phosphatase PhoE
VARPRRGFTGFQQTPVPESSNPTSPRTTARSKPILRLTLLAHAPTLAQREARFAADDDAIIGLPSAAVELLQKVIGRCDGVMRGPERRAEETAHALGMEAVSTAGLRAWSAGAWAGRSILEVAQSAPEAFAAWRIDPDAGPPVGESLRALLTRTASWLTAHEHLDGRLLVIADQPVLRAIVLHALDAPPATFWRFDVGPLSLSVVQRAENQWRLRSLGLDTTA